MDIADGMDKSWDHPWTTEEMREKRREWSLAGDAGLLKHLQQFSENLISKANKTQESLDSLNTQLNETAILIDNITNTSLALANTQFIESRVQDDDNEVPKEEVISQQQEIKDQDTETTDVIASVSESIKKGLKIMDEKYKRLEVVDSDSEEEGDGIVLSVILEPNNPYQDRPLPYVIGSDKWKASSKIGLETSSSESEQIDEEDEEESESDKDDKMIQRKLDISNIPKSNITRLSSSSTESDNYNNQANNIVYINNGKLDAVSQATINTSSESITPNPNLSKAQGSNEVTPNFAEELAKRLGSVRQTQNPITGNESKEPSINKLKDDLFATENKDVFINKSDNRFNGSESIFDDQLTSNLWKEQPNKSYKTNVIPPSMDVPPPISAVSTKPKSAIDDLFADADSEDSDDIFSSKSTVKKITKDSANTSNNKHLSNPEEAQKKYLDFLVPGTAKNIATSTPETNANTTSLFSDEEDDGDLFGTSKAPEISSESNRKKPIGGVSILGNILTSDIENRLSNRILRQQSSGSSSSDTTTNYDNGQSNTGGDKSRSTNANNSNVDRSFIIAAGYMGAEDPENSVDNTQSSGISIQPRSINNTMETSAGPSFQPEMTSTRLKSEEIYRERIVSDSLFAARTRNSSRPNVSNATNDQSPEEQQEEDVSSSRQDDVFENEDLFGPPPLPKAGAKSVKSKVTSLFDDSDSGDELFSTTSSGSRSQKSTDFLVTTPQNPDKAKSSGQRKGIFDEDIDIFGTKDAPDVDLFAIASKSTSKEDVDSAAQNLPSVPPLVEEKSSMPVFPKENSEKDQTASKRASKKNSLFDDDDDDADLFNVTSGKNEGRVFKGNEEDDLFSSKKIVSKQPTPSRTSVNKELLVKPELDITKCSSSSDQQKKGSNLSGEGLFSKVSSAQESLFDDEDFDDLFVKKEDSKKDSKVAGDSKIVKETKIENIKQPKIENPNEMSSNIDENKEKIVEKSQDSLDTSDTSNINVKPIVSAKPIVPAKPTIKDSEETAQESVDGETKKYPPKTLNIKVNISSSNDENNQAPKRAVSGKIKDLMGKMGDFKVLSPTDKPPLWRRSEEKTDEDEDMADRDSDDGGCISTQSRASPPTISEDAIRRQSPPSGDSSSNAEGAVSFDDPVQVETLATASKSRVRIQAKRRPQSRHARKSALRNSGIDFDTVDTADTQQQATEEDQTHGLDSDNFGKELSEATTASSRLSGLFVDNLHRNIDTLTSSTADDRSELGSLSKESSMSANKNTLLSPSTDEEDLFDVPPDLPEDSQKEDFLFGRAPILSPIDNVLREKPTDFTKSFKDTNIVDRTIEGASSDNDTASNIEPSKSDPSKYDPSKSATSKFDTSKYETIKTVDGKEIDSKTSLKSTERSSFDSRNDHEEIKEKEKHSTKTDLDENVFDILSEKEKQDSKVRKDEKDIFDRRSIDEPTDPLRDSTHDPLKDPSQLFAFVTKTSSPEKGKNLLFTEDDSLFSSGTKRNEPPKSERKQVLDLFADDTGGDIFSAPLTKSVMKPLKDTKITLFDDDVRNDEDDSLFGSVATKLPEKIEEQKSKATTASVQKKLNIFDDDEDGDFDDNDDDGNLFVKGKKSQKISGSEISQRNLSKSSEIEKSSKLKDIFDDQSSGDDDIFAAKKILPKKKATKSLFASDDEDNAGQIFIKPSSSSIESKSKTIDSKPTVKKAVTRDLKKTAEKIVEDPLSLLQDD